MIIIVYKHKFVYCASSCFGIVSKDGKGTKERWLDVDKKIDFLKKFKKINKHMNSKNTIEKTFQRKKYQNETIKIIKWNKNTQKTTKNSNKLMQQATAVVESSESGIPWS